MNTNDRDELLSTLRSRFEHNMERHKDIGWTAVQTRLESHPEKIDSLYRMEQTGGEPDVAGYDAAADEYLFFDCSSESPLGRRNMCYDREAQQSRKNFTPEHNVLDFAAAMGVELLTEDQYLALQQLGNFDTKTSSWIKTPADIRKLGGALFGDRRYGHVFIYHNGAPSYYGVRGFRSLLRV